VDRTGLGSCLMVGFGIRGWLKSYLCFMTETMSSPDCTVKQDGILRYDRQLGTEMFQVYICYI